MKKKIKYPEGGLTINSGQAYPNSTNQTGGSMGATVADPYGFSFSTGATTLTPEQWKKLNAEQQQAIWRKAFDMQGFTQIGPNSFSSNGKTDVFAMGGPVYDEKGKARTNSQARRDWAHENGSYKLVHYKGADGMWATNPDGTEATKMSFTYPPFPKSSSKKKEAPKQLERRQYVKARDTAVAINKIADKNIFHNMGSEINKWNNRIDSEQRQFAMGGQVKYPDGGDTKGQVFWEQALLQKQKEMSSDNPNMKFNPVKFAKKQQQAGEAMKMLQTYYPNSEVLKSQSEVSKQAGLQVVKAGLNSAAFERVSSNKTSVEFAMGGNTQYDAITGALSPVIGMIPGGQFINMGLDLVGNFIPKKEEPKPYTGVYSMGGRAKYSKYEVEGNEVALGSDIQLEGSSDESSFGKIARGASHANGGVDGVGAGFILSDRIGLDGSVKPNNENSIAAHARPIMKALSKMEKRRDDAISRMGKNILSDKLNVLKDFNEKMVSSQSKQKFFGGGETYPWEEESATGVADNLQTGTPGLTEDQSTMIPNYTTASPYTQGLDLSNPGYTTAKTGVNLVDPSYFANAPKSIAGAPASTPEAKVGGINMLTAAGMGISGLGALGQIINTVQEHKRNQAENPEQNFYEDISARAEQTYGESLNKMNAMKMKSARDINDAYGSVLSNQGADSINVDRAMKNVMYSQRAKGIADSNLNYDAAIADRKIGLSNLQFQGDMAQAEGRTNTLINKQQNLANYFTNLGANISDATGQALNAVKIAQNAKTQTQALMLLKDAYPNFTLSELTGMLQIILK